MLRFDTDYPIKPHSTVQVALATSRQHSNTKTPWLYLVPPKSELFDLTQHISETTVVYLAGFIVPLFGWRTLVIREEFPDAIFEDVRTSERIRVEFESFSSHFIEHNHPPSECDAIICWEDDISARDKKRFLSSSNSALLIIELKKIFHHYDFLIKE